MSDYSVPKRFVNEEIANHWLVDGSESSFARLLKHLQVKTHFYYGFCKAFDYFLDQRSDKDLIIADVGAGVGWTSAIMAKHPKVKKVYCLEPSTNRRSSFEYICKHWNVDPSKVEAIKGSFTNFRLPEKADAIVMCASIHHCHDDYLDVLFKNIDDSLIDNKGKATILIANEDYVNVLFSFRRLMSYIKNRFKGKKPFWSIGKPRHYHPHDLEHWRTKSELSEIFTKNNFKVNYKKLDVDLCNDKPMWEWLIMWEYYYATLDKIQVES